MEWDNDSDGGVDEEEEEVPARDGARKKFRRD
jgi:hypothetical protein